MKKQPNMKRTILWAEDDATWAEMVTRKLEQQHGYQVNLASTVKDSKELFEKQAFDLVMVDVYMPSVDSGRVERNGLELARWVRIKDEDIPIIYWTASTWSQDRIEGYKGGCDYFLVKTETGLVELGLRIANILSRYDQEKSQKRYYKFGGYTYDARNRHLIWANEPPQDLTKIQGHILKILARHFQKYVPVERILEEVWENSEDKRKVLHVHICDLRIRLQKWGQIIIRERRELGYALVYDPLRNGS